MRELLRIAIFSLAVTCIPALAQEPESAGGPPLLPAQASGVEGQPNDTAAKTDEELIQLAYDAIETAEAGGPDAQAALNRAGEIVREIRARDLTNPDAEFISGRANLLLGRPREAISAIRKYTESSRKGENDWLAFKLLGDLYFAAKYYEMARDKYAKSNELNPGEPGPLAGLAQTWLQLAQPDKAVEAARNAIDRDNPSDPSERNPSYAAVLATALLGNKKFDQAADAAAIALELARENAAKDPTNTSLLMSLDRHHALLESISTKIIERFPERANEHVRLVRVQRERAEIGYLLALHRILNQVEVGLERSAPNPPPALKIERAELLKELGATEEAAQGMVDLLASDPTNAEARQLLEQIRGASSE